jgi:hypothetical protein
VRRLGVLAVALAVLISGCGRFSSGDGATPRVDREVGDDRGVAAVEKQRVANTPTTVIEWIEGKLPANTSVRDIHGFRMYLSFGEPARSYTLGETVRLILGVENRTGVEQPYDTNAREQFKLVDANGNTVWTDVDCRSRDLETNVTGVVTLEPRETVSYSDFYPARETPTLNKGNRCRVEGEFDVIGMFPWCAPGSMQNGTCWPDRVTYLESAPLRLTITG